MVIQKSNIPRLTIILQMSLLAVAVGSFLFAAPTYAAKTNLKQYTTKHYLIHSNLTIQETRHLGLHMDAVYEQYTKRFTRFSKTTTKQANIYLFRQNQQYLDFLSQHNINANNSGAMFFIQPDIQGLAAYLNENSLAKTLASLQHEGFHQFAAEHIGKNLPVWINEGLAQYFEDGLLIKNTFRLGHFDTFRSEFIKQTLASGQIMDFSHLVNLTEQQWHQQVINNPARSQILYAQTWSIVYFLANNSHYSRNALEDYLHEVSNGNPSSNAFFKAYNVSPAHFTKLWANYAVKLQPDSLSAATTKMQFLAESMRWLENNEQPPPATLQDLRKILQAVKFKSIWESSGFKLEMNSLDETLYQYTPKRGDNKSFRFLEPDRNNLPPRITAEGMIPEPTLVWARDPNGTLRHYFKYR